jgi:hypothetical protein
VNLIVLALTVLRFITPVHDSWGGVAGSGCEESPAPVGILGEVRLCRLDEMSLAPEQVHAARQPGEPDSFFVDASDGVQRTYYVTATKITGVESCRSNYVTLNGSLDVQPAPAPVPEKVYFYDLQGRSCKEPMPVGIYWRKQGREVRKVVVLQ